MAVLLVISKLLYYFKNIVEIVYILGFYIEDFCWIMVFFWWIVIWIRSFRYREMIDVNE